MTTRAAQLSIVVPALNEEGNVRLLVERIAATMEAADISYDILFIDDFSTDNTVAIINELSSRYPVSVAQKIGKRGKAFSILQGVAMVDGEYVCMIDADLQYPPEAIAPMLRYITDKEADVVLTRRHAAQTSWLRQLSSSVYNLFFTKLLFGIDYDTQSGLKVFRRDVFDGLELQPSPWSFDLEFIVQCLLRGYKMVSFDIEFAARHSGKAKLSVVTATIELIKATLALRIRVPGRRVRKGYERNRLYRAKLHKAAS